jgi:hypothetical protein
MLPTKFSTRIKPQVQLICPPPDWCVSLPRWCGCWCWCTQHERKFQRALLALACLELSQMCVYCKLQPRQVGWSCQATAFHYKGVRFVSRPWQSLSYSGICGFAWRYNVATLS